MVVGDMDMIEVVKVNYVNGRIGQGFGYRPAGYGWSSKCERGSACSGCREGGRVRAVRRGRR